MMNAIDIICESCDARMRLSETLLSQIAGRTGRITCKRCEKKVGLDATGDEVSVTYGGHLVGQDDSDGEPISATDPHLSEFPAGIKVTIPPPISDELKARRRLRAIAAKHSASARPARSEALEAPEPPIERGSLSPHTLADEEDDGLVPMGREFQSSPYVNERDATFQSLYPSRRKESEGPASVRLPGPAPQQAPVASVPRATEQREEDQGRQRVGAWLPWAVAAGALFALGVSLSLQLSDGKMLQAWTSDSGQQPESAELATQAQSPPPSSPVEPEVVQAEELSAEELVFEDEPDRDSSENAALPPKDASAKKAIVAPQPKPKVTSPATAEASPPNAPSQAVVPPSGSNDLVAPAEDEGEPEEEVPVPPFSTAAASATLREVTAQAGGCRGADDPSGIARIQVTFAPSGRVTNATVSGPPFAGTTTGSCIASRFRSAQVPPFAGDHVTVAKTVTIR